METELQSDTSATLESLPAHSRVWVFPLQESLSLEAAAELGAQIQSFLSSWDSHGAQVLGSYLVSHARFLLVAADPESCSVSGCSIDSLYRAVEELLAARSLKVANLADVFYLADGQVEQVTRAEFKQLAQSGELNEETLVFDTSIQSLGNFQNGQWLLPRRDSWHEKLV